MEAREIAYKILHSIMFSPAMISLDRLNFTKNNIRSIQLNKTLVIQQTRPHRRLDFYTDCSLLGWICMVKRSEWATIGFIPISGYIRFCRSQESGGLNAIEHQFRDSTVTAVVFAVSRSTLYLANGIL